MVKYYPKGAWSGVSIFPGWRFWILDFGASAGVYALMITLLAELLIGWKYSLYVNFIDFEKAIIDSVDRDTLLKILKHHGIPEKVLISL